MRGMKNRQESRLFSIFPAYKGSNSRVGEVVWAASMNSETQNAYDWEDGPTEASAAFFSFLFVSLIVFVFFWVIMYHVRVGLTFW
jgi:hypothetical protein